MLGISERIENLPLKVRERLAGRHRADPRVRNHVDSNDHAGVLAHNARGVHANRESYRCNIGAMRADIAESVSYKDTAQQCERYAIGIARARVFIPMNYFPFLSAQDRARARFH